jgi:hypothetical protein
MTNKSGLTRLRGRNAKNSRDIQSEKAIQKFRQDTKRLVTATTRSFLAFTLPM